ncbi:helix-turn-helix transcriptional regulator [Actinoplanes subtropicus]|uniref:helix-turn-helix transcriptional regulator n=1 Tax=Actinoplanes subtropicus TaxID=543632 RepID=UPI0004C340DF|nr:AlpA family phage regulatory protein [Actinoplanes subtropicus]
MSAPDVFGLGEVAELLGVDRYRAYRATLRPDFPRPCSICSGRRVWYGPEVRAWIAEHPEVAGRPA